MYMYIVCATWNKYVYINMELPAGGPTPTFGLRGFLFSLRVPFCALHAFFFVSILLQVCFELLEYAMNGLAPLTSLVPVLEIPNELIPMDATFDATVTRASV
eukprot:FR742568.1.p1 GENE.FR742568.1~~FR742568.1.p1  ORF type:complete len:102 (-),score=9.56 FR742568.1:459-764(-)